MLLKGLGFAHSIISPVALLAGKSLYHERTHDECVLHYAGDFAIDQAIMLEPDEKEPYYHKHWRSPSIWLRSPSAINRRKTTHESRGFSRAEPAPDN